MNLNNILVRLSDKIHRTEAEADRAAALANRICARMCSPMLPSEPVWVSVQMDDRRTWAISREDWFVCEKCGTRTAAEYTDAVRTNPRRRTSEEIWCNTCTHDHAFRCAWSGAWWTHCEFNEIQLADTGEFICQEYGEASGDLYWWNTAEEWRTEPEHDDDQDDDEDEDARGVAGYHSQINICTRDNWRRIPDNHPRQFLAGIELEVWAEDANALARVALDAGLLAERDGSLDARHGVELIGAPLLPGDVESTWAPVLEYLRKNHARAHNAGQSYGMHVSLPKAAFGRLHLAKLMQFVNSHQALCEAIAQRPNSTWAAYSGDRAWGCYRHPQDGGKYRAVHVTGARVEFRIFRANLKTERVLKNVEFCFAVAEFTRFLAPSRCNKGDAGGLFSSWVQARKRTYPNLAKFLSEKVSVAI